MERTCLNCLVEYRLEKEWYCKTCLLEHWSTQPTFIDENEIRDEWRSKDEQ